MGVHTTHSVMNKSGNESNASIRKQYKTIPVEVP